MMISFLIQASVLYLPGRLAVAGFVPLDVEQKPVWKQMAFRTVLSLVFGLVLNAWGAFILGASGFVRGFCTGSGVI